MFKKPPVRDHLGKFSQREFSAGGVVYKIIKNHKSKVEFVWLVTRSNPSKLYPSSWWRLPKGWLDEDSSGLEPGPLTLGIKKGSEETLRKTALREVEEEAGVKAKIIRKIGTERYFFTKSDKSKTMKFVIFYLMEWQKNLSQGFGAETSEIKWLDYLDARKRLTFSSEKRVLDKAKGFLTQGIQENLI